MPGFKKQFIPRYPASFDEAGNLNFPIAGKGLENFDGTPLLPTGVSAESGDWTTDGLQKSLVMALNKLFRFEGGEGGVSFGFVGDGTNLTLKVSDADDDSGTDTTVFSIDSTGKVTVNYLDVGSTLNVQTGPGTFALGSDNMLHLGYGLDLGGPMYGVNWTTAPIHPAQRIAQNAAIQFKKGAGTAAFGVVNDGTNLKVVTSTADDDSAAAATLLEFGAASLGFFGATPAAQPAAPVTLGDVIAALKTLGLVAT